MKIRRRRLRAPGVGDEPLLEPQRVAAVLVVAAMAAELPVAALAVARDGGVIGLVHLEADGAAAARQRGTLRRPRAASARRRARPCAGRPRWNRAARRPSAAGTARWPYRRAAAPCSATITSALGDLRKRRRLRRDSRSVANTRCSSSVNASTSPGSALRVRTSATGARARLEGIVGKISLSPPPRTARVAFPQRQAKNPRFLAV